MACRFLFSRFFGFLEIISVVSWISLSFVVCGGWIRTVDRPLSGILLSIVLVL